MTRKAFDAGLSWETGNYIIRMDVSICDYATWNEPHRFHLQLCSHDNIDTAKYLLSMQIWERFGRFPKPSTFQLERHLRFTDPVTSVETLALVHFARTSKSVENLRVFLSLAGSFGALAGVCCGGEPGFY